MAELCKLPEFDIEASGGRGKRMKIRYAGLAAIAGSILLVAGLPAWGQITVSMSSNASGTGTWESPEGDVYTGVYTGTATGVPNANPGIVCDDFSDTVYSGETWKATGLDAASLTTANIDQTMFGATIGLQGYAEVATLVSDMFNGKSGYTPTELSSAIWYITAAGNPILSAQLWADMDSAAQALVKSLQKQYSGLTNAAAEQVLAQFSNLWILTPIAGSQNPYTDGEPQEMWLSVPEGGAALLYLLLAGAACFGGLFSQRRRLAPNA